MRYEEALELIKPNIDSQGLIIHNVEEWGGGDTAQREGMWAYGLALQYPQHRLSIAVAFNRSLEKLQVPGKPGNYVRHPRVPGAPDWYDDPYDFTRDQSIPLLAAMGRLKNKPHLKAFFKANLRRGMFCQNGRDPWWGPNHLNMWYRAFADAWGPGFLWYLNPFLWLGDLFLIFASIFACARAKMTPDFSDDINFQICLLQTNTLDTPLAQIARGIYARYRPAIAGTYETWGPASGLEHYFFSSGPAKISGAPRIDLFYNKSGLLKNLMK